MLTADALGLGLRLPHFKYVLEHVPSVDYFEIIADNFFGASPVLRAQLDRIAAHYPIAVHGVGLNLLGHEPLDDDYLDALARLADELDAPFVTDHLCWTGAHGIKHHDLLPAPYVPELVEHAAKRAQAVQARLGRPFGVENLSSYVTFRRSTLTESEFYAAVVRESGCWFMLDINNVYVSSQNHRFDPDEYLASIDFSRVVQVHLAGHTREPDGTIIDTHDQPVADAVWQLYRRAWQRGARSPTLLEWDARLPTMPTLLAELAKAKVVRE